MGKSNLTAIDFFCGGGGMTCGLRQAGINVVAGVDFDPAVGHTYEYNNPGSKFIHSDINLLSEDYFEKSLGVKRNDDNLILVGCSPCQFYSIINTDRTKSLKTKDLLMSFAKFIEYYKPGFVLVENVPGIVTNKDSILPEFLNKLVSLGYGTSTEDIVRDVIDLSYYGVPQSRRRFSLVATRIPDIKVKLPEPEKEQRKLLSCIGVAHGFPAIEAGHKDDTDFNHSCAGLSEIGKLRMAKTKKNGGSRLDWANDRNLQLPCYEGKDESFTDNYGRMSWDKPSPTITTKFLSISNGRFGHPEEDRAISIREGASIQTFPTSYVFKTTSMGNAAKIIGNAVPCEYARRLGETIKDIIDGAHES